MSKTAKYSSINEDPEDFAAFDERADEPTITYEELLEDLKGMGKFNHAKSNSNYI